MNQPPPPHGWQPLGAPQPSPPGYPPAPGPDRPLWARWWLWAAIAAVVVLAVGGFLVFRGGGDGAKTADLRHYLAYNHQYKAVDADPYKGLGTVTYSGGDVTVDAPAWSDNDYGAYLYCSWVESWLHSNGSESSTITVRMGGQVTLQTHNLGESCQDASYRAKYGG